MKHLVLIGLMGVGKTTVGRVLARRLGRELVDSDLRIVLLTARPISVQPQTLAWLAQHELRWDLLVMREWGDYGAARDFKQDAVHELRHHGFDLRLAFEDDRRNVDMFHREGVPCVYIHSGYYE